MREATSEGHHSSNIIDARWNNPTLRVRKRDYAGEETKSLSATFKCHFAYEIESTCGEQTLIDMKPIPPLGRSQYTGGGGGAVASSNG